MIDMKPLWECPSCGETMRSDALGCDDWGGEEVAIGPDCPGCDEAMELADEPTEEES